VYPKIGKKRRATEYTIVIVEQMASSLVAKNDLKSSELYDFRKALRFTKVQNTKSK